MKKQQQTITCQWNSCYPNSWLSYTIRHNRATCAPELCTTALTTPWIFCRARDSVEANMASRTFSLLCWKKRHVPHRKMHARKAWKCEALKNICVNPVTPSFPGSAAGAAALKYEMEKNVPNHQPVLFVIYPSHTLNFINPINSYCGSFPHSLLSTSKQVV